LFSDEQREDAKEPLVDPVRDSIEFPLEKPPIKRNPTWCSEILRKTKKNETPKCTFSKSKKLDKYSGLIAHLNLVID
jgi:hypothetical protein